MIQYSPDSNINKIAAYSASGNSTGYAANPLGLGNNIIGFGMPYFPQNINKFLEIPVVHNAKYNIDYLKKPDTQTRIYSSGKDYSKTSLDDFLTKLPMKDIYKNNAMLSPNRRYY